MSVRARGYAWPETWISHQGPQITCWKLCSFPNLVPFARTNGWTRLLHLPPFLLAHTHTHTPDLACCWSIEWQPWHEIAPAAGRQSPAPSLGQCGPLQQLLLLTTTSALLHGGQRIHTECLHPIGNEGGASFCDWAAILKFFLPNFHKQKCWQLKF